MKARRGSDSEWTSIEFDDPKHWAPSGVYWLRGGICWPVFSQEDVSGYAVAVGKHADTGAYYILEEERFLTVNQPLPMLEDGKLIRTFSEIHNDWNKRYLLDSYYWHQPKQTNKKHLLECIRSAGMHSAPHFVYVRWDDEYTPMHTLFELDITDNLLYRDERGFITQMERRQADDSRFYSAVHAVTCAISGIERADPEPIKGTT